MFGNILEASLTILDTYVVTEIVAMQSRRRLFVLANSACTTQRGKEELRQHVCITLESWTKDSNAFQFCSCRSYFERTKGSVTMSTNATAVQPQAICKHLLALKLRPDLKDDKKIIEAITEEQFSYEVAKLLCLEFSEEF